MWIVYALTAAVLWGISYAACGRVIGRGMSPLVLYFLYTAFGAVAAGVGLLAAGRLPGLASEARGLGGDFIWLAIGVVTSAAGALLIFMAIGGKNATLASLIEISYPFFVALFVWLFFREAQLNFPTLAGGLMILGGVVVVFVANRG